MKIRISDLRLASELFPAGYFEEVSSRGTIEEEVLILEDSAYRKLNEKYSPQRKIPLIEPAKPIAYSDWPIWAKALAKLSTLEDKGIGDVVARTIGDERSAKFKAWYLATFGKPCGCNGRQRDLNIKYPLPL